MSKTKSVGRDGEFLRQSASHPLGRITLAGRALRLISPRPMEFRIWDTYALVYVLEGKARFYDVTGFEADVGPGHLMLMFPRHGWRYHIDPADGPWSEIWLQFQGPLFDLWRQAKLLDPRRPVYQLHPMTKWTRRLNHVLESPRLPDDQLIVRQICRLQTFLAEVLAERSNDSLKPSGDLWLTQARQLLDKVPLTSNPDWTRLSEAMGLSYERFRKRFTLQMGTTPGKYLMAKRIDHACAMLEDRSKPLKEITRDCGFFDVFHFSRRFKAGTGLSPTQYRRHKLHDA